MNRREIEDRMIGIALGIAGVFAIALLAFEYFFWVPQ